MNAVNALARDQSQADFDARLAAANGWIDTARPIIVAYFKLDEIDFEIRRDMPDGPGNERTAKEARRYVAKARQELFEMIDGIRCDFLADELPPQPRPGAGEHEWDARDAAADALEAEVISIKDAEEIVEREWNDAFAKGER